MVKRVCIFVFFTSLSIAEVAPHHLSQSAAVETAKENMHPEAASTSPSRLQCENSEDLKRELAETLRLFRQVQDFVDSFGIEIAREQNLQLYGEIKGDLNGSLEGSGKAGSVGNLGMLAKGIAQAGPQLLTQYPISPLMLGKSAFNFLQGLAGFGYGEMKIEGQIKGSLSGQVEGKGYEIHESPSLFVVFTRQENFAKDLREKIKSLESAPDALMKKDEARVKYMRALAENPYVVDSGSVKTFQEDLSQIKFHTRCIEDITVKNLGDQNQGFALAETKLKDIKSWLSSKRIIFADVLPYKSNVEITRVKHKKFEVDVEPGLPGISTGMFTTHSYLGYVMARSETEAKQIVTAGKYHRPGNIVNFTYDYDYTPTVQAPVLFATKFSQETGWVINERENPDLDLHQVLTARYGHPYKVTSSRKVETSSGWAGIVHIQSSQEYFENSINIPEVQEQEDLISKMHLTEVRLMK